MCVFLKIQFCISLLMINVTHLYPQICVVSCNRYFRFQRCNEAKFRCCIVCAYTNDPRIPKWTRTSLTDFKCKLRQGMCAPNVVFNFNSVVHCSVYVQLQAVRIWGWGSQSLNLPTSSINRNDAGPMFMQDYASRLEEVCIKFTIVCKINI